MSTISIPLDDGKHALIDDSDWSLVSPHKWRIHVVTKRGTNDDVAYVSTNYQSRVLYLHRLILNPKPRQWVDHINGDRFDCRRENLRIATPSQNIANSRLSAKSTSGYKGVTWNPTRKLWEAQIHPNGKHINLGRYRNPEDAADAYDEAALRIFGEYARTNKMIRGEAA